VLGVVEQRGRSENLGRERLTAKLQRVVEVDLTSAWLWEQLRENVSGYRDLDYEKEQVLTEDSFKEGRKLFRPVNLALRWELALY
jgi:hypothetical protein